MCIMVVMNVNIATGEMVRRERKRRRVTQTALAKQIDISNSTLCELEAGAKTWTVERLIAVAEALDCRLGDVLPPGY